MKEASHKKKSYNTQNKQNLKRVFKGEEKMNDC